MRITIDPAELKPGDIVVAVNDHDISGCHCDVLVTVDRDTKPPSRGIQIGDHNTQVNTW